VSGRGFDLGDYVEVKDRIKLFYELYGNGRLMTTDVRLTNEPDGVPRVLVEAKAYRSPDDEHPAVGWSWMELPGKTTYTKGSEIENTETSAWGRAIAALGILVDRSIASQQEVSNKSGEEPSGGGTRRRPADAAVVEGARAPTRTGPVAKAAPRPAIVRGLARAKENQDFEARQSPQYGLVLPFRVGARIVIAEGEAMVAALTENRQHILGAEVIARGNETEESFTDRKVDPPVERYFKVLHLESIEAPDFAYPPASAPPTPAPAVAGSPVPPAGEPQPSRCESLSPYNDDPSSVPARCTREPGHKGTHRAQSAETWA
jgi:hypothetical protein